MQDINIPDKVLLSLFISSNEWLMQHLADLSVVLYRELIH